MPRGYYTKLPDARELYAMFGKGQWGYTYTKKGKSVYVPLDVPPELKFACMAKRGALLALKIADVSMQGLESVHQMYADASQAQTDEQYQSALAAVERVSSRMQAELNQLMEACQ